MNSPAFWIGYVVLIFAFMYFIAIKPQQKEKKKMQELMASIAVGDTVLTSSGFYGVIIDTLSVADGHQLVTVIVYYADGNQVAMAKDSVNGYLSRMMSTDVLFGAVAKFTASDYANFH